MTAIPNPAPAILFAIAAEDCVVAATLEVEAGVDEALTAAPELEAAEAAELISDETEDAAEDADEPVTEVTEPVLLPVLPLCGTGVTPEVGVPVDAQVALVGRLVTPWPAQSESANLMVTGVPCH